MKCVVALLALVVLAAGQDPSVCKDVKPDPNFKYGMFEGQWYEIGSFRNPGALIWNADCVCSSVNVTRDAEGENEADSLLSYSSNELEPSGEVDVFVTDLVYMSPPGKWKQIVAPVLLFDPQDFVVLEITDEYALTYRCGDYILADSYTILIMGRKPTLDEAIVAKLIKKVESLELNAENALYIPMEHTNCTYVDHGSR